MLNAKLNGMGKSKRRSAADPLLTGITDSA
jgi:hypothetical protein